MLKQIEGKMKKPFPQKLWEKGGQELIELACLRNILNPNLQKNPKSLFYPARD